MLKGTIKYNRMYKKMPIFYQDLGKKITLINM